MTVAVAAVAGFLAGRVLWLLLRQGWAAPLFARENYRGHVLPTAAGIVLPLAVVVVEGGRAVAGAAGVGDAGEHGAARLAVALAALGFGLLGLLDDLAGSSASRGFRGHLVALARGELTTGAVKLFGGAGVALVVASVWTPEPLGRLVVDAAVVALAANLGNLFDRAPGRCLKVGVTAFVALVVVSSAAAVLAPAAVVVGAGAALLLDDLRERLMLGDTGANVLGAAVGVGVVTAVNPGARAVVAAVLLGLNLLSEIVSFSRVIDAVPPLRGLDRAGRRPR